MKRLPSPAPPLRFIAPPIAAAGWGQTVVHPAWCGMPEFCSLRLAWHPAGVRRPGFAPLRAIFRIRLLCGRAEVLEFRPGKPWKENGLGSQEALAAMDGLLEAMSLCPGGYPLSADGHEQLWAMMLAHPAARNWSPPFAESLPPSRQLLPPTLDAPVEPAELRCEKVRAQSGEEAAISSAGFLAGGDGATRAGTTGVRFGWLGGVSDAERIESVYIAETGLEPVMRRIDWILFGVGGSGHAPGCWAGASRRLAIRRAFLAALGRCPDIYPLTSAGNTAFMQERSIAGHRSHNLWRDR